MATFKDICLDADDHHSLADWWCTALGYRRSDDVRPPTDADGRPWSRPPEWPVPIVDPEGRGPAIWVVPVPEAKTVKNRMHLDVHGETRELLDLGARVVTSREDAPDYVTWDVLADPEGNEFCVFDPPVS